MIRKTLQAPETRLDLGQRRVVLTRLDPTLWRVRFETQKDEVLESRLLLTDLENAELLALPDYLDLPVLLRFEEPLKVPPDIRADLYTLLPVQYEIVIQRDRLRLVVGTLAPMDLQTSWEGAPTEGELVYHFQTPLFQTLKAERVPPGTVALPLQIFNASGQEQTLDHILVDSYQLSLYDLEGILVAEVVEVHLDRPGVEIRYTDRAPAREAREIRKGLENVRKRGLSRIASRTLKSFVFRELI